MKEGTYERRYFKKKKDIEVDNNDNTCERFYKNEENVFENKATQLDIEKLGEKTMIQNILHLMKE